MIENKEKEMQITVPYIVHEAAQAGSERIIKRLIIALIITIILLFVTNAAWLFTVSQYEITGSEVTVDTEGSENANYVGQDGDIYNGTNNGTKNSDQKEDGR